MQRKNIIVRKSSGFVQLIIIIIMAVIIMSLLGVSISSLVNNKTLKENFAALWSGIQWLWSNYLGAQAAALWHWIQSKI